MENEERRGNCLLHGEKLSNLERGQTELKQKIDKIYDCLFVAGNGKEPIDTRIKVNENAIKDLREREKGRSRVIWTFALAMFSAVAAIIGRLLIGEK